MLYRTLVGMVCDMGWQRWGASTPEPLLTEELLKMPPDGDSGHHQQGAVSAEPGQEPGWTDKRGSEAEGAAPGGSPEGQHCVQWW